MAGRRLLVCAVFVLCCLQAGALSVHVSIDWPAGGPTSTAGRVRIRAIRVAGTTDRALPVETEAAPDESTLDLGDGVWHVQASASGYWSQEVEVTVARQASANVRLALLPAAFLHGEIVTADGEPLPRALEVWLTATAASARETAVPHSPVQQPIPGLPRVELSCAIDKGTWSCLGPSGLFDLRLEASGYAPRYLWGVSMKPGENADLGRTELRRTASVFGRAVRKDGSEAAGPCRAILQPDIERHGGAESVPDSALSSERIFSVPLTPRGYFQVVGVLPGTHVLDVKCQDASAFRKLSVQADGETRVDPPVQLEELTLDIEVTPKVDPAGRPWRLTVDSTSPLYRRITDRVETSADGRWITRGLMAGSYRVMVSSADGTSWLQRDFNLHTGSKMLSLRLSSVKVAGRVLLNSEPVRARLVFFNDAVSGSVTLRSDDDGRFQGVLPANRDIQGSSWTVEAHVARPKVNQRLLGVSVPPAGGEAQTWLDLELPTIAVHGSVVSKDGKPQRGVQVTFEDSRGTRVTTGTDDAGNFEMPDLPPGEYTVVADSPEGVSDHVPFQVLEGRESELKLVLNAYERVPFYVVSKQGPVADATVQIWMAPGVPRALVHTDQDGRFDIRLPSGVTDVGLTVGAPGYALKLTRLAIPTERDRLPDANTITLNETGGKLVLNFQPPDHALDGSAMLYLLHDGIIQDARTIAGWGTDQVGTTGDGPAVVDAIEPGIYALCVLANPAELSAVGPGLLASKHCTTDSVQQGGTLTLSPR